MGVTGGLANDYNSCLAAEFCYAESLKPTTKQAVAQLYVNTADPANSVADWPSPTQMGAFGTSGLTDPYGTCQAASPTDPAGANSTGCAYVYGYDMVAGITYSNGTVTGDLAYFNDQTAKQLYGFRVWLDVETANSWQSGSQAALGHEHRRSQRDARRAQPHRPDRRCFRGSGRHLLHLLPMEPDHRDTDGDWGEEPVRSARLDPRRPQVERGGF